MIYTNDNRLLMTVNELKQLFSCSYSYIDIILNRFDFPRIKFKNRGTYIDINKDFAYKVCDFMRVINNKKSRKIIEILENLDI